MNDSKLSEIPAADRERISAPLKALEAAFRPLVSNLPPELEPDYAFAAGEEESE